jgi:hypothetical protein
MNRILFSLVAVGVLASCSLGADLKSGPQVGDSVSAFNPLNINGPDAGEKRCQV